VSSIAGKPKLFKAHKEVSIELSAFPEVRVISSEEDRASMVSLIKEGIPASAEIA
jgi:hypothetical protein